jgi:hypothetical protein
LLNEAICIPTTVTTFTSLSVPIDRTADPIVVDVGEAFTGTCYLIGTTSAGGGGIWGSITGTLADQTDLQTALDAKQASDADLTAVAGLAATAGLVKRTGAGAFGLGVPGTDYVAPAGNVATATALAANGANCSAGQAPLGVDASGAAEGCTAYQASDADLTAIAALACSDGQIAKKASGVWTCAADNGGGSSTATAITSSSTLPGTCAAGDVYFDTDATSGIRFHICDSTNTWRYILTGSASGTGYLTLLEGSAPGAGAASGEHNLYFDSSDSKLKSHENGGSVKVVATEDGNVATATALAANPANCSAGQAANGVAASGAAESCIDLVATYQPLDSDLTSLAGLAATAGIIKRIGAGSFGLATAGTDYVIPAGNVATATALAANGANCSATQAAGGVDASGAAEACIDLAATYAPIAKGVTNGDSHDHNGGDGATIPAAGIVTNMRVSSLGITVDGGGSAITTGTKGFIVVPFSCTIQTWSVVSDQSGSIVLDVWKSTGVPSNANTITASAKPTLSSAQLAVAQAATGWTTAVAANDVLGFEVESASTVTKATLTIACQR